MNIFDGFEQWLRDGDMRLEGARMHESAAEGVATEALRCMVEAHTLVVNGYGGDAIAVLEQGIAEARYALNQGPEPAS
jgi:hypothetical protein